MHHNRPVEMTLDEENYKPHQTEGAEKPEQEANEVREADPVSLWFPVLQ